MAKAKDKNAYKGKTERLVISIDLGTTYTAASWCILESGVVPKFESLLHWPGQLAGDAKVPSVLYYGQDGAVCAAGAEAENEQTTLEAELNGWQRAEWFKLRLRPSDLKPVGQHPLPKLPENTTVEQIFADFFAFVAKEIQKYITDSIAGPKWQQLSPSMYIILTTPNGWETRQQYKMREAIIKAGLVDEEEGHRVKFVSEAEAAILYAAQSGNVRAWLQREVGLVVCDCGAQGGTIDITGYRVTNGSPLGLEETSPSHCYIAGAIFINERAVDYIKVHLKDTKYVEPKWIRRFLGEFEIAKRLFKDPNKDSYVKLDGFKSNEHLGIIRGCLKISGREMASFFAPCIETIKLGLINVIKEGGNKAQKIILVGGLASSDYVFGELVAWGAEFGAQVCRPDNSTIKAVAEGALAWHVDASVSARVTRFHYGTKCAIPYSENCDEMKGRTLYRMVTGDIRVNGAWCAVVAKGRKISKKQEFGQWLHREFVQDENLDLEFPIYSYSGKTPPMFIKTPGKKGERTVRPGFTKICTIRADLKEAFEEAYYRKALSSGKFKSLSYRVVLYFDQPEITARLQWTDNNGINRYSAAVMGFD